MIRIVCASCGGRFEVAEEFAGQSDFCPICGTLNDIPPLETEIDPTDVQIQLGLNEHVSPQTDEIPAQPVTPISSDLPAENSSSILVPELVAPLPPSPEGPFLETVVPEASGNSADQKHPRGIPSPVWWGLLVIGISAFIGTCVHLLADTWENQHIAALTETVNRGDTLMTEEDFSDAATQYRSALDTIGSRKIESVFIRQLIDHAKKGEADAMSQLRERPSVSAASTNPSSTTQPGAASPLAKEPTGENLTLIRAFQRSTESFPHFAADRPILYKDATGNWRRRQFIILDVTYDQSEQADPPQITLHYDCMSRLTEGHAGDEAAQDDGDFRYDEWKAPVHCQITFDLINGKWFILHRPRPPEGADSISDIYPIEEKAFEAKPASSFP